MSGVHPLFEESIEVLAYSGYRGEETPTTVVLRGRRIEVIEILEQWIEEKSEDRSRRRCFKIKGRDGAFHLICYDEKLTEWFYAKL